MPDDFAEQGIEIVVEWLNSHKGEDMRNMNLSLTESFYQQSKPNRRLKTNW